jgi:predicted murein hydrolase (TIGR00659 family)
MIKLWGIVATLVIFVVVLKLKNNKIIGKVPPTVVVGITLIAILKVFGIDYSSYNESACILTILLGPATVALAYPLVENLELLTKNKRAVYFGLVVATLTALCVTLIIGKVFHTDPKIVTSLIPKSVTTPIAVEISRVIGGIPELTACIVVITGVYGAMFGHRILKLVGIKSDVAKGLAIGSASHVLGTSTCVNRRKQLVMATLALILTGILTTVLCIIFF